jgi:hypothetical protein
MKKEDKHMKGQRFRRIAFWVVAVLFLLACSLPSLAASPTQAPQSLAPELLGTSIAQTAVAAQTQTVIYAPPSLTPTLTPLPTWTPVTLSPTPTFVFALPTVTALPTWTPLPGMIFQIPGGGGNSNATSESLFTGKEWTCAIRDKNPAMGAIVAPGASFYVSITLFNNGTRAWPKNSVDFRYRSGLRNDGKPIQDFPRTVASGSEITLQFLLTAPDKPDIYNTVWSLKVGRRFFCGVKYSFKVE